jgi:hypothetical protein
MSTSKAKTKSEYPQTDVELTSEILARLSDPPSKGAKPVS